MFLSLSLYLLSFNFFETCFDFESLVVCLSALPDMFAINIPQKFKKSWGNNYFYGIILIYQLSSLTSISRIFGQGEQYWQLLRVLPSILANLTDIFFSNWYSTKLNEKYWSSINYILAWLRTQNLRGWELNKKHKLCNHSSQDMKFIPLLGTFSHIQINEKNRFYHTVIAKHVRYRVFFY